MSVFDLFRGFFGVPGGQHRGRRDPFFDVMTHDEDDEEEEEDGGGGSYYDRYRGGQQDPFDSTWRFGFSFGPDGMRIQEPPVFGQVLRQMEEIFSQMGHWDGQTEPRHFGVPSITPPPPQDRRESSRNPLRDFMLKTPDSHLRDPDPEPEPGLPREPRIDGHPFSMFSDIWRETWKGPLEENKEDRDLDAAVSSEGLDQIFTPPAGQTPNQPRSRSIFQSVTVTKVVKPDGTVEERRTVRDSQGNEETTVTRSGGRGSLEGPHHDTDSVPPGGQHPFSNMRDDDSLFSKFFGGFK
ncbi:HCLS1-associated protein X-1 [Echeneis naucrates]|uniref:HCLS1 associated protein X-1 n=1 Tax=Echeneis naucrates TaxID=173247 RepID=A0A665WZY7_ECHNA|nr:HCLS1-associated protein X-1 [Echeneis naucrates]